MGLTVRLEGLDNVMQNLSKEIKAIEGRTIQGLIDACIIVWRDMEGDVPFDLGNLRASFFIVTSLGEHAGMEPKDAKMSTEHMVVVSGAKALTKGGSTPVAVMGFSANYAVFVHENMEAKFRSGKKPKFFENALKRNSQKILKTIAENAEIK